MIVQLVYSYWLAIQVACLKRSIEEIALVFWVISLYWSWQGPLNTRGKKKNQPDALD